MTASLRAAFGISRNQPAFAQPQIQLIRAHIALRPRNIFLRRDGMGARAIEINRPDFAKLRRIIPGGNKSRVANPEGARFARMIGANEPAFIMAAARLEETRTLRV